MKVKINCSYVLFTSCLLEVSAPEADLFGISERHWKSSVPPSSVIRTQCSYLVHQGNTLLYKCPSNATVLLYVVKYKKYQYFKIMVFCDV
jgi:hypothetical protein